MAKHAPDVYEQWLAEMTGLELRVQLHAPSVAAGIEELRVCEAEGDHWVPIFAIPTQELATREDLEACLPPHLLQPSATHEDRRALLQALRSDPFALSSVAAKVDGIDDLQRTIAQHPRTLERMVRVAETDIEAVGLELDRMRCALVYSMSDLLVKQSLRAMRQ